MHSKIDLSKIEVGVVGLGLMGSSIIVSLLLAGHAVTAIAPIPADLENVDNRIYDQLNHCSKLGLLNHSIKHYQSQLKITQNYGELKDCDLVFECVIEEINIKESVYKKITEVVGADAIVATNTSAIAISILQKLVVNPGRFIGIHWAEPAYATRFLEITCGENTCANHAEWIFELAHHWGKEPTLLRKDIRGFITNRLMYAVYREIFHQVDNGTITIEDADKAFRYDAGSWMTLMGVFRRMDFLGLEDCMKVFASNFLTLSNADNVPQLMQKMVTSNSRGTQNLSGLYPYTLQEAKKWEEAFALFNKDIYELASIYPLRKNGAVKKVQLPK